MKNTALAICLILLLNACAAPVIAPESIGVTPAPTHAVVEEGTAVEAFFTNPLANARPAPVETALVDAIDQAQTSVDVAVYSFTLESVAHALLRAAERGLAVRLVTEGDARRSDALQLIADSRVQWHTDDSGDLMHHKFIIIDGNQVWTGSLNLSTGGAYYDHNNLVSIRDARAAQNFQVEFDEMFASGFFGRNSRPQDTPYPQIELDGRLWEFYFSPDDGVQQHIERLLRGADESIHVLAYAFTLDDLGWALVNAHDAGVEVVGVFESEKINDSGADYDFLRSKGLDVRLDGLADGLMHHKVIIVDGESVAFGSYNFTRSAENENDENLVIAHDPALAAQFEAEFQRILANSAR
ncbi:MAG: DUF1669 domain-containing protein [Anaerolineae bacterium]|nr:DUF1669 domain-containing protein [Anaerolineae bacterium]